MLISKPRAPDICFPFPKFSCLPQCGFKFSNFTNCVIHLGESFSLCAFVLPFERGNAIAIIG